MFSGLTGNVAVKKQSSKQPAQSVHVSSPAPGLRRQQRLGPGLGPEPLPAAILPSPQPCLPVSVGQDWSAPHNTAPSPASFWGLQIP